MHRLTPFSLLNLPLQGLNFVEILFLTENSIHVNVPQARFTLIGEVAPSMPIKSSGRIVPPGWAPLQPKQSVLSLIV